MPLIHAPSRPANGEIDSASVYDYDTEPLSVDENIMPFSEENQRWIQDHIREATHPNGFNRVVNRLRYWGLLGVCVTAFLALIAVAITLGNAAYNRATVEAEFRGATKERLSSIDTKLGEIEKSLLALRIAQASSSPTSESSISEARALIETARASSTRLPVNVVKNSGVAFIEAAAKQPSAWNAAVDFLNYRTTLNVYARKVDTVPIPNNAETVFDLGKPLGAAPLPQLSHIAAPVAAKDGARFESIGHNLNEKLEYGSAELALTGGAISVDDRLVAHAVFIGVEVHYTGKLVVLRDVLFIDCKFVFDNNEPGRSLGREVLASSTITFEKNS